MEAVQGTTAAPNLMPQPVHVEGSARAAAEGPDRPTLVTPTDDLEGTATPSVDAAGARASRTHPLHADQRDADGLSDAAKDAPAGAKDARGTDYMRISVDHDELAAFKLRSKISEVPFMTDVWPIMLDLKWTHQKSKDVYFSPTGEEFPSAKVMTEQLDRFGMPERGCSPPRSNDGDARRARRLRDDVLEAIFKHKKYQSRKKRKGSSAGCRAGDDGHDCDEGGGLFGLDYGMAPAPKQDKCSKVSKGIAKRRQSERKSATSIDPGAQMCFEGTRASRTRKKTAKKNDATESTEKPAYQVWPDPEKCVKEVRSMAESSDDAAVEEMEAEYWKHFADWRFLLATNHSLLLYGFGSKRSVLDKFSDAELTREGDVLTLDGYDRDIGIDQILDVIVNCYLNGIEPRGRNAVPTSQSSASAFGIGPTPPNQGSPGAVRRAWAIGGGIASARSLPLFVVLHSVDGIGLRSRVAQDALAALVAGSAGKDGVRMVRLAASVDHVNASALLWDTQTVSNFAWVWKETRTYRPYYEEVRLGAEAPIRKVKFAQARSSDDMGFVRVLQSLGPRNAECLQALARLQLRAKGAAKSASGGGGSQSASTSISAVSYKVWRKECFDRMCASNDTNLRLVLKELTDHGIVEEKVDETDGANRVFIPHRDVVLDQILGFSAGKLD